MYGEGRGNISELRHGRKEKLHPEYVHHSKRNSQQSSCFRCSCGQWVLIRGLASIFPAHYCPLHGLVSLLHAITLTTM